MNYAKSRGADKCSLCGAEALIGGPESGFLQFSFVACGDSECNNKGPRKYTVGQAVDAWNEKQRANRKAAK